MVLFCSVFVSHSVNDIDDINDKNVFVNHFVNDFANDFENTKVNTKSRTDNDNRKHSTKRTLEKVNISDVNDVSVELLKFKFLIRNTRRQCNAMPPLS